MFELDRDHKLRVYDSISQLVISANSVDFKIIFQVSQLKEKSLFYFGLIFLTA